MREKKIFKNLRIHLITSRARPNLMDFKKRLHLYTLVKRQIKSQSITTISPIEVIITKRIKNKQLRKDNNKHTCKESNHK